MQDDQRDAAADLMRGRADAYTFLARALSDEQVTVELLRAMRDDPPRTGTALDGFAVSLAGTDDQRLEQVRKELAADHSATLLGMGPQPVSPFESVYTSDAHLMMQAARDQVREAYHTYGLGRDESYRMPDDHLSLELDFMALLAGRAEQEAQTGETGSDEAGARGAAGEQGEAGPRDAAGEQGAAGHVAEYERLLQGQAEFLGQHLTRWVPRFCDLLEQRCTTDFYRGCAQLLRSLVEADPVVISEALSAARG